MVKRKDKIRIARMRDTRFVYQWEEMVTKGERQRPMKELRALGERIWRENTGRRDRCPRIVAGRGLPHCGGLSSVCWGRSRIVLARHQRKRCVIIHEMAHALGPETHGRRFQIRLFDLLARYA